MGRLFTYLGYVLGYIPYSSIEAGGSAVYGRSEGFPLAAYSIPGRNGTWAWTPWEILLGAPVAAAVVVVVVALGGIPNTGYAFQHESYSEKRSERDANSKLIVIAVPTS